MFEIYRRFDNESGGNTVKQIPVQNSSLNRQNPPLRLAAANPDYAQPMRSQAPQNIHRQNQRQNIQPQNPVVQNRQHQNGQQPHQKAQKKQTNFLKGFLPTSIYDPKQKKLFGFLSAEDLLLAALIFLLLEKDDEDNLLMILALSYVLISEYIEIPEFEF